MKNKLEVYYPKDSVVNISSQPKKYLKDDYSRCFSNEMLGLAVDKDFSGNDLRVFLAVLANLKFENTLNISQQELSNQLKIHRSDVAKAIKKLVSKGYLEIIDNVGRQNIYMFNPNVAFKSRAKNFKKLKQTWNKETTPNTQDSSADIDLDLDIDFDDKLEDKVSELSKKFGVSQSKVRQILLSVVNQALTKEVDEDSELPY